MMYEKLFNYVKKCYPDVSVTFEENYMLIEQKVAYFGEEYVIPSPEVDFFDCFIVFKPQDLDSSVEDYNVAGFVVLLTTDYEDAVSAIDDYLKNRLN